MASFLEVASFYNTFYYDTCLQYDLNGSNYVLCNDNTFNSLNALGTILVSVLFGTGLSFACVAYSFFSNHTNECSDKDDTNEENSDDYNYNSKYDSAFLELPKDGYSIKFYPFNYKIEEKTPNGDIILFLTVKNEDYKENSENIQYTYFSNTNSITNSQLLCVAKKMAIELNTKQFYSDKTISFGNSLEEFINNLKEKQTETNNTTAPSSETVGDLSININTNDIPSLVNDINKMEPVENNGEQVKSVFAKLKKYNKSSQLMTSTQHNVSENNVNVSYKELSQFIQPTFKRIGTIHDYEETLIQKVNEKNIKNISFKEFKQA